MLLLVSFVLDVRFCILSYINIYKMSARYESLPIPNLPDYAFGERLGAGSYGKKFYLY